MKKILSILAAVLFVSSLSAKTIYCKMDQAWWNAKNDKGVAAGVACYAWTQGGEKNAEWPGVRMEAVENEEHIWSIALEEKFNQCIFVRVNGEGDPVSDWGAKTKDQVIPTDEKDLFTIAEAEVWGDPGCDGEWSKYVPAPVVELPYVALIGEMNEWDGGKNQLVPAADKKTASAKINLEMNDNKGYGFKILVGDIGLSAHGGNEWYKIHSEWNTAKLDWVDANSEPIWLAMNAAGEYTFTFSYADSTLTVTFPSEGGGGEEVLPSVAVAGSFNDWKETAAVMTPAEDKLTASVKIQLAADQHEFKIVVGNTWLAKDTIWDITRENPTVAEVNKDIPMGPNLKLFADVAGEYIFTWTFADSSLAITFPKKDAQGISNTAIEGKAVKTIMNGQLVIIKGGKVFNANGAQIQ